MLSRGRRTVKFHRFGERGSEMGGGAGTSCPSISLETSCIMQTPNGQTEDWPPGRGRAGHAFPATGSLGLLLSING